ncbi:MAG: hypothetical protein L0H94_01550 [Nitrospira sp.]|nr:hypothetical protein [Nitrospira sp.]
MLKCALILSILALAQAGCSIGEGGGAYEPVPLTDQSRSELEGFKRDFLRKEKIVVQATLTASCIPVLLRAIKLPTSRYMFEHEVWCSSSSEPQRSPSDPIWHMY